MKTNIKMTQWIRTCKIKKNSLASTLRDILDEGLIHSDGCILLNSQLRLIQPSARKQFEDETGYECFVNHLHLEDLLTSTDHCVLLEQAFAFAQELARLTEKTRILNSLAYIISGDDDEVNVRFHVIRAGQSWLAEDLEVYGEAVAILQLPNMQVLEQHFASQDPMI